MCLVNIVAVLITNLVLTCRQKCAQYVRPKNIKYICPLLKEVMNRERDNNSYGYDNHPEQVPPVNNRASTFR